MSASALLPAVELRAGMLVGVRRFDQPDGELHWLPVQRCELDRTRGAYRVVLARPSAHREQLPGWFWIRPNATVPARAAT